MNSGKKYGKKTWLIPDGFYNSKSTGAVSHEAVCVLNTGDNDAEINMTLYFEDRHKMPGFKSYCLAGRTHHIRMDKLLSVSGQSVPMDTAYAILVESSVEVVVQYSRLDTSQAEMALMTTVAYPVE